jgi:hypothetical protein
MPLRYNCLLNDDVYQRNIIIANTRRYSCGENEDVSHFFLLLNHREGVNCKNFDYSIKHVQNKLYYEKL